MFKAYNTVSESNSGAVTDPAGTVHGIFRLVRGWMARSRQRRDLGELTDDQLHDIGISHDVAAAETAKPFWR